MSLNVQVQGVERLLSNLSLLPHALRKSLDDTIDVVGEMIKVEAQRIVPVHTGTLQRSIFHNKIAELTHEIGAAVFYAVFVEYGTSRMRAQPYLRPAIQKYQDQIRQIFCNKMEEWMRTRGE